MNDPRDREIWLDLSRLPWRAWHGRLTGIDRVELAYAMHLLDLCPDRLRFTAFDYRSGFRELPRMPAEAFVRALHQGWSEGRGETRRMARRLFLSGIAPFAPALPAALPVRPVWLNVSTHPLCQAWAVRRMLRRTGAAFVPLLHDVIPIENPEYVPRSWTRRHRSRLKTVAECASGVIANSRATAQALALYLPAHLPVRAVPLGVDVPSAAPPAAPVPIRPYFVMLGTIEPRKNHITLLHVFRDLVERFGAEAMPGLLVVGSPGWENEHIMDVLERCTALKGVVTVTGALPDAAVAAKLANARALLMPSFREGFGLPVAEALAMGCPVICSDIAAHREVGGAAPDYIDPIDGAAWRRAILDYAQPDSLARHAQLRRLQGHVPTSWRQHVAEALAFAESIAGGVRPEALVPRDATQPSMARIVPLRAGARP